MASSEGKPRILAEPSLRVEGVVVDALGYVDDELEDLGMRERVDALILEEMASFQPPDYLEHFPRPSTAANPLIEEEMERIAGNRKMNIPDFGAVFESVKGPTDEEDLEGWRASLARAKVALEAQTMKSINVELMSRYGVDIWKAHAEGSDKIQTVMKARVAELQAKIDSVNATRKTRQEQVGGKLRTLRRKWRETVENNLQVELACQQAERQAKRMRKMAEEAGLLDGE